MLCYSKDSLFQIGFVLPDFVLPTCKPGLFCFLHLLFHFHCHLRLPQRQNFYLQNEYQLLLAFPPVRVGIARVGVVSFAGVTPAFLFLICVPGTWPHIGHFIGASVRGMRSCLHFSHFIFNICIFLSNFIMLCLFSICSILYLTLI